MILNLNSLENLDKLECLLEKVNSNLINHDENIQEVFIKNSNDVRLIINEVLNTIKEQKRNQQFDKYIEKDKIFAEKLINDINSNIKYEISTFDLAFKFNISEKSFARKIKKLFKTTPCQLIKSIKLKKAKELINDSIYDTVSEISYAVGYNDPHYFSKIFLNEFGVSPRQLIKN